MADAHSYIHNSCIRRPEKYLTKITHGAFQLVAILFMIVQRRAASFEIENKHQISFAQALNAACIL